MITYAIGDIHGMFELLEAVLQWIDEDAPQDELSQVVFIGDYVDRGMQSRQVIERLIAGPTSKCQEWICLKGNHDHYFADAILRNNDWQTYMTFGCGSTLESYDIIPKFDDRGLMTPITEPRAIEHAKWVDTLPYMFEDDYRFFVHAGFKPGGDPRTQSNNTMMWIREEFLGFDYDFGKMVVHGHTPMAPTVTMGRHRINIDTGCGKDLRMPLTVGKFVDNEEPQFHYIKYDDNVINAFMGRR